MVTYHPSTISRQSTITAEEAMLSSLSSIYCSNTSNNTPSFTSSKSVAYIVGTYKDKVDDQQIFDFDKKLQKVIRSTDCFHKDIVKFCTKDKLIIAMDNMNGGKVETKEMHKILEDCMEKYFKKFRIPGVWLLFSHCLCMRAKRTASLGYCLELSKCLKMSPDETKVALWFLHHHAGILMHFPEVPGLEDLIILETQVVYDSVTKLILRAMTFENVGQAAAENFRKTGQFLLDDVIAATAKISGSDFIPPHKLVTLLEYLHIIARIETAVPELSGDSTILYLMPCVLEHASREELDLHHKSAINDGSASPLMVHYKCGFVPIGIFPALIACLVANKSFDLVQEGIKKNLVSFYFGLNRSLVTFMSTPKYYEIVISDVKTTVHTECVSLREELESSLERASSRMSYGCFMDYQFSFECSLHPGKDHVCVVKREEVLPRFMDCLDNRDRLQPVEMSATHLVWYGQVRILICVW